MRVETEFWEVAFDNQRTRYSSETEARANRGGGVVRRRVDSVDVPAAYAVVVDGVEVERFERAALAAAASKATPGATVHMVACDPAATDTP